MTRQQVLLQVFLAMVSFAIGVVLIGLFRHTWPSGLDLGAAVLGAAFVLLLIVIRSRRAKA